MAGLFDKANEFLESDKGEQASDAALKKAAEAGDSATGGGHKDAIDKARDAADQRIGGE